MKFNGKILVIGCGSVSQCTLPLLLKHIDTPARNITLMDFVDNRPRVKEALARGVRYVQKQIVRGNYSKALSQYVGKGDMIVEKWYVQSCETIVAYEVLMLKSGNGTDIMVKELGSAK